MTGPRPNGRDAAGGRVWDAGLQPERTALSWRRTGLALLVGSLLLARVLANTTGVAALAVGAVGLAAAIATLIVVELRYRSHHRRLLASAGDRIPLAGGRLPFVVAVTTLVLGCGAAVAVILIALKVS